MDKIAPSARKKEKPKTRQNRIHRQKWQNNPGREPLPDQSPLKAFSGTPHRQYGEQR